MKIPSTPITNSNGCYNDQESGMVQYPSDNSDSEETNSPTQDGDFSEYLWMENEEEFDNQVIKQLEEEALMEQCIEAMLEDEREGQQPPTSATTVGWSNSTCSQGTAALPSLPALIESVQSLQVSDDVVKGSTLNPNATEFVPRDPAVAEESKA